VTTEMHAERIKNEFDSTGDVWPSDIEWLIDQALRAQELDNRIQNKILPEIEAGYKQNMEFREENARLREVLEFYADDNNYKTFDSSAIKDAGSIARAALAGESNGQR